LNQSKGSINSVFGIKINGSGDFADNLNRDLEAVHINSRPNFNNIFQNKVEPLKQQFKSSIMLIKSESLQEKPNVEGKMDLDVISQDSSSN
jgi:hypothetical protein